MGTRTLQTGVRMWYERNLMIRADVADLQQRVDQLEGRLSDLQVRAEELACRAEQLRDRVVALEKAEIRRRGGLCSSD